MGKVVYIITFNRYGRKGAGRTAVGAGRIKKKKLGLGKYRLMAVYDPAHPKVTFKTRREAKKAIRKLFPKSWRGNWNPRVKKIEI